MERSHTSCAPPAFARCETLRLRERDGLRVALTRFPKDLRIGRHHHDRACLTVVLDGVFEETFRGRPLRSTAGWILAKPAGEPHSDAFGRDGSRQVILELDHTIFAAGSAAVPAHIRHHRDPRALTVAHEIARELDRPDDGFVDLAVQGLALELLALHARAARRRRDREPWLRRIRDMLHDCTAHPPSLAVLAAQAGVHENHLIRRFRDAYGHTPAAYGRRVRLELAAHSLRTSELPIATIALRTGFADQSHFTRWFRAHTGTTPAAYRAEVVQYPVAPDVRARPKPADDRQHSEQDGRS